MSPLSVVGIASLAVLIWNAARARLMIVTVIGDSMVPALVDGDRLLVLRCGAVSVAGGPIVL